MLGTAQTDTLSAQLNSLLRIFRRIGIGADLHGTVLVSPSHDAAELTGDL